MNAICMQRLVITQTGREDSPSRVVDTPSSISRLYRQNNLDRTPPSLLYNLYMATMLDGYHSSVRNYILTKTPH